jgi:hypothetical protein
MGGESGDEGRGGRQSNHARDTAPLRDPVEDRKWLWRINKQIFTRRPE